MELFRIQKDIPFMRYALLLNAISVITFLAAVFFLWQKGLHLSIEFTGGTVLEVQYEQSADLESIRSKVTELGYGEVFVQNFGSSKDVMIRLPLVKNADGTLISSTDQSATVLKKLQESHPEVKLHSVDYVGPQVGDELLYGGI
jgi:preprotein translocase subunit SecF